MINMNEEVVTSAKACYRQAEEKAAHYFHSLFAQVNEKTYTTSLIKDIQAWKHNHIHYISMRSFFCLGKCKPDLKGYHNYIQWLNSTGKLDNYLDRSISYIFMRDLGKVLDSPDTINRVKSVVDSLKSQLINSNEPNQNEVFNLAWLYRKAQKEEIEPTFIWLINKIKIVSSHIPGGIDAIHALRKLIKIIVGVLLHAIEELKDEMRQETRIQRLDEAIRLGYSYGLTYPFIDDLLDSKILSTQEKKQYSDLIRATLIAKEVPKFEKWNGPNKDLIRFIHSELQDAFIYIKSLQHPETIKKFFEQSFIFFHSQEADRQKDLSNANYTNEELYIPIILKSSSSRMIIRSLLGASEDKDFDNQTFFYGIYNQLADDFADMFDDMSDGAVTPYTYYLKHHEHRPDFINPFELYWTVISNLIHNVFHSDIKTCEVILSRVFNGLKRFKEKMGSKKYKEVMDLFVSGSPKFYRVIQKMVRKANDVDFFDKLLRDHMITILRNERNEQEIFQETIKKSSREINNSLLISKDENISFMKDEIIDAANYSLKGDGKRLRPIMAWVMCNEYGLNKSAIIPLLKSLEYLHTASLIFDDLPSQDNSSVRRGRSTLHKVYNVGIAELTGLFLTQTAVKEQASLTQFDPKTVLKLVQYSTQAIEDMCKGQAMDLNSKGKQLTIDQLNLLCFYKTGLGFEASLILPAILAHAKEKEMEVLKNFAHHAGIAFQIKDDLLDLEGDFTLLGKPIGKDAMNNNSTFVTVLGVEEARKLMWEHYCLAMDSLQQMPRNNGFMKQLLNYIVNRDH
ncbi:MAG: polyprenyl synthetase family protein [Bacillota bacterium]|nr:polyprenyl synthetase family protein [Bacillota bacterium]